MSAGKVDVLAACDWPADRGFIVQDEIGEHDPCYVYMPDGGGLAFNHHAVNGVDQARAEFVAEACNFALGRDLSAFEQLIAAAQFADNELSAYKGVEQALGSGPGVRNVNEVIARLRAALSRIGGAP